MPVNIRIKQNLGTSKIKEYMNIYIFSFNSGFNFKKNKNLWQDYIIPIKREKENISENIDKILY